jgi:glutamate--cysteine ligase
LLDAFERHGAVLETKGVDPINPINRVPLQLHRERYERMTQYFESIGPSGIRMMRQTASVQLNIEPGADSLARWTLLNRVAPMLVAIFANSRRYAGENSGHASYRAHLWRTLDSSRTGLMTAESPVESYCDFATGAGWMFGHSAGSRYDSFGEAIGEGANEADWDLHLSTLFPEVRPRRYFEVRSPDMVDLPWIAAPIAMMTGVCYHDKTADAVSELLSRFDSDTLVGAGRDGLADKEIAGVSRDFIELALRGAEALGSDYLSRDDLDILHEFVDRYPANGRSPADDA